MTSLDTHDLIRDTISRKKFLLATGAAAGATLIGSAPQAHATGIYPAYTNVIETFTADQTFTGKTIFATGQPWVDVTAFGAVGNGVADDAPAIQAAINAAVAVSPTDGDDTIGNPIIYFPPGDYLLKSGLVSPNNGSNFCLKGAGYQSSRLVWSTSAPAGQAMLQLINPFQVHIRDLGFIGTSGANMPTYGIQMLRAAGALGSGSSQMLVERVFLGGTTSGGPYLGTAIAYTADSAADDLNGENGTFRDVSIQYVNTGYGFGTFNGECHLVLGGSVQNCAVAAIDTKPISPSTNGGSFSVYGTRFTGNALTFNITQPGGTSNEISLVGIQAGTSASPETQLLNTPSPISSRNVIFVGGHAILAPPGAGNSIFFNGDASAMLEFHGFRMTTTDGAGVAMTLGIPSLVPPVTSGSPTVNFYGGKITTKTCNYNGALHFHGTVEAGTSPVFTPYASSNSAQLVTLGYKNHISGSNAFVPPSWLVPIGAAGTGALITVTGNNLGGVVSLTTGPNPFPGIFLQVFFPSNYPVAPLVLISPGNANAAGVMNLIFSGQLVPPGWYHNFPNAIFFSAGPTVGLAANTPYVWNYLLVG